MEHHRTGRDSINATATKPATGPPIVLATYQSDEGPRQLINGKVALSDVPAGADGKVYLVERHVPCTDELDGPVSDYCKLAE